MILTKLNEELNYNGQHFYIGQRVVGTDQSEYDGLFGTIFEIRDGEDKETENDTPDIYCSFESPILPHDLEELEKVFSNLYNAPKSIDDITLDMVIIAPEMIAPLDEDLPEVTVYVVTEDWVYKDETGFTYSVHSDLKSAIRQMRKLAVNESNDGLIQYLRNCDDIVRGTD